MVAIKCPLLFKLNVKPLAAKILSSKAAYCVAVILSCPPFVVVTCKESNTPSLFVSVIVNPYISALDALPNSQAFPASFTLNTLPADIPLVDNCAIPTVF